MKRILKNRLFIVIITLMIGISGTLYATTKYQASDVLYNPSDGESMTVNEALNDLYNNSKTECEKDSFCSKVKLGDYIKMTPTETTYTILSTLTGYSSNQTINPSELNIWRIIKKNNDGTIEMVSENVSSTNIYFQGKKGYLNFTGTLNLIASQYGNSKYTINSRIMGYNGQTATITDTSKFTYPVSWQFVTSDNSYETLGGGDMLYEKDTNLVNEALGTLVATTPSGTITSYWLNSRGYGFWGGECYNWNGRFINNEGILNLVSLYSHDASGWYNRARIYSIRPILTLKLGITVTGSGTSDDPWVLQ